MNRRDAILSMPRRVCRAILSVIDRPVRIVDGKKCPVVRLYPVARFDANAVSSTSWHKHPIYIELCSRHGAENLCFTPPMIGCRGSMGVGVLLKTTKGPRLIASCDNQGKGRIYGEGN